jgi:hypothetical protein
MDGPTTQHGPAAASADQAPSRPKVTPASSPAPHEVAVRPSSIPLATVNMTPTSSPAASPRSPVSPSSVPLASEMATARTATVTAVGGVRAPLRMTPPGDGTEAQARQFASSGRLAAPITPGGAVPVSGSNLRAVQAAIGTPGCPLDTQIRHQLEQNLGLDLAPVRVHTHGSASASARALRAKAYTVGPHIVFAPGRYQPGTEIGRELLAHELAHVAQQAASGVTVIAAELDVRAFVGGIWGVAGAVAGAPGTWLLGKALSGHGLDALEFVARQIVGDTLAAILHQFLLGFQTGLESAPSKQTEGLWDRVDNISFMDIYDFGSGFSTGIDKGLRRSFKELVDMVLDLLKLPQLLGDFLNRLSELAARYKLKLSQLKAKGGGLSERLNRLDDAFARDPHALERLLDAVSSFALAKVREGGIDAAGQLLKYLEKPWDKIGEDFGDIAGQILFQVLLAVGTDLIGNLVEEAIALTGRLAALAARAAEGAAAAMRTVEGLIGEALKWVEKVGGQLAGEAGELFEAIKAVLSDMRVIFADLANEGALADTGVGGVKLPVPGAKGATALESRGVKPPLGTPPKTVADLTSPKVHPSNLPQPKVPAAEEAAESSSVTTRLRGLKGKAKEAEWVTPKQVIPGEVEPGPGLRAHFEEHGAQVGAESPREYDLSARQTIQNGRRFFYNDWRSGDPRVGYWDPKTGFFTATSETRSVSVILSHYPLSWKAIRKFRGFTGR